MKRNTIIMGAAIVLAGLSAPAFAENFAASTWLPQQASVPTGYVTFAERVAEATNGDINFEIFVGGALLPPRETLQGVGRGVAMMGQITAVYTPADLPLNNVVNDLGFLTLSDAVGSLAATDVRFNNADLQSEWSDHNIIYSGSFSTPTYYIQCTSPIRTLADAAGKNIRATVGAQVDFLTSIGAVPVSVPGSDVYSGLERGSIDCTLLASDALLSLKTIEVVTHVTELPLGVFLGGATWGFNKDFWADQTPENRRILLDQTAIALVENIIFTTNLLAKANAAAVDKGLEIIAPDAGLQDALTAFNATFLADLPASEMEKRSIADPSDMVNEYVAAQEKWTALLADVDLTDHAALLKLVNAEIFSKLDENTYGLN
ncbi:C4-dicarboxylate TRAP transporter substrate-binding protein [Granulosicoccus antarcticus]|uniref:Solute-binding protein n=1 Tax=Granulosicoccus antarcticus IMCC3135 TaxID=1192854 RepID=A0A2Z2NQG3_9GAMM|nr:C4-dicarboxylate TRAP transporter substrate-binding protein [Granulosicoccus antarcticus]ASJ73469.1 Solute-binding protein [Granulosicoccus antarcticus IMCC3135]